MSVPDVATESRNSLYGLHRLELGLLKESSNDGHRLVQARIKYQGAAETVEMTATIELSELRLMLDRLFEAVEREDDDEQAEFNIDDVIGIWPNMTGGKSIEDYKDSLWEYGE